jgi:G:T-mismatch repair DNA endonuclease (very short patch repair protein)
MADKKPRRHRSSFFTRHGKTTTRRTKRSSGDFWKKLAATDPNNLELTLLGLITWLGLPYKYTGNAGLIIHGKCPDFAHESRPKLIELFGERWHSPEEEQSRIEFFARAGYQVLIIWGKEMGVKNRKKLCQRLKEFECL